MKLQVKISLILIASMIAAAVLSFLIMNLLIVAFDRSYSWYDLEKIALDASRDLAAGGLDAKSAAEKLGEWKGKYRHLVFTLFNEKRDLIYSTDDRPRRRRPEAEDILRRMEEDEKRASRPAGSPRFVDTLDRAPYMVMKPVVSGDRILGMLSVSVRRDFFLPFYIRVNDEKIADSYVILFTAFAFVIGLSFLLVLLFTAPLILRLRRLYAGLSGFELGRPAALLPDPRRDEIGEIQNTFNRMAERIHRDYEERVRIFKERQELLRNISHDFRTPLTSILGYAASLEEGLYEDEAEQRKYYGIIRRKAEYMTKLFNEMMELTRFDADTYVLKRAAFDLAELAREIIIEYLPQLEAAGFVIETDIPENLEFTGDRERLSRALRNLIDNVVTHAAAGKFIGVYLRRADGAGSGRPGTLLEFCDRGPGVAGGERERIFQRFYSAGAGGGHSGMGLGLAIAKEIVEKHGGAIELYDNGGRGAAFRVFLPE